LKILKTVSDYISVAQCKRPTSSTG